MTIAYNVNALIDYTRKNFDYNIVNFSKLDPFLKGIVLATSALTAAIALPTIGRIGALVGSVGTFIALTNYLSQKINQNQRDNRYTFGLFNKEIDKFKDSFSSVDLKNKYWWFIDGSTKSINKSDDYKKNDVSSNEDNYLNALKGFENYSLENLGTLNPNNFDFKLKFALVEKKAEDVFNVYAYDRDVQSRNGVEKTDGGIAFHTLVPKDAVDLLINDMFNRKFVL